MTIEQPGEQFPLLTARVSESQSNGAEVGFTISSKPRRQNRLSNLTGIGEIENPLNKLREEHLIRRLKEEAGSKVLLLKANVQEADGFDKGENSSSPGAPLPESPRLTESHDVEEPIRRKDNKGKPRKDRAAILQNRFLAPFVNRRIRSGLELITRNADLHKAGKEPFPVNRERYEMLTLESLLENEDKFNSLVSCYRRIFGDGEVWGEGAYCSGEHNWDRLIPLDVYQELQEKGEAFCPDCGSPYVDCYPPEELKERITEELSRDRSAVVLMYSNKEGEEGKVVGFAWGFVADVDDKLAKEIADARFKEDAEAKVGTIKEKVIDKLRSMKVNRALYFSELGVEKDYREKGVGHVKGLVLDLFEAGLDLAVDEAQRDSVPYSLFWTSRESPIYAITRIMGYAEVAYIENTVFLVNNDVEPVVKIIQNNNDKKIGEIMLNLMSNRRKSNKRK